MAEKSTENTEKIHEAESFLNQRSYLKALNLKEESYKQFLVKELFKNLRAEFADDSIVLERIDTVEELNAEMMKKRRQSVYDFGFYDGLVYGWDIVPVLAHLERPVAKDLKLIWLDMYTREKPRNFDANQFEEDKVYLSAPIFIKELALATKKRNSSNVVLNALKTDKFSLKDEKWHQSHPIYYWQRTKDIKPLLNRLDDVYKHHTEGSNAGKIERILIDMILENPFDEDLSQVGEPKGERKAFFAELEKRYKNIYAANRSEKVVNLVKENNARVKVRE